MVAMIPAEELGVVVLGNAHFAPIAQMTEAVLDIMLGLEPSRPTVSVQYAVGPIADRFDEVGAALASQDRLVDAVKILDFNARQYSSLGWAHEHLGEAYVASRDTARALEALEQALVLDPTDERLGKRLRTLRAR